MRFSNDENYVVKRLVFEIDFAPDRSFKRGLSTQKQFRKQILDVPKGRPDNV